MAEDRRERSKRSEFIDGEVVRGGQRLSGQGMRAEAVFGLHSCVSGDIGYGGLDGQWDMGKIVQ